MDWLVSCLASIWNTVLEGPWYSRMFIIIAFLYLGALVFRYSVKLWIKRSNAKDNATTATE